MSELAAAFMAAAVAKDVAMGNLYSKACSHDNQVKATVAKADTFT